MLCPNIPPLETPPGEVATAKYVVVVDTNGNTKVLIRPVGFPSLLFFDGDNAYWAYGNVNSPIILPGLTGNIRNETSLEAIFGLIGFTATGGLVNFVNESTDQLFLTSFNGTLHWSVLGGPTAEQLLPQTGSGILVKSPFDGAVTWDGTPGVAIVNTAGEAGTITNGTVDQIFKIDATGQPVWANAPSGTVSAGSASMGLDGVQGANTSLSAVNIKSPTFTLSDGTTTLVVTNVNVSADLLNGVAVNGLDAGAESNNVWYYFHIITDGVTVSALISTSATAPVMPAPYTHWGMASVFRNDSGGNIRPFLQRGRRFSIGNVEMSGNVSATTSYNAIPQSVNINTILPPITKLCSGMCGGSPTATTPRKTSIASTITGIGTQIIDASTFGGVFEGFSQNAGNFQDLAVEDPAAIVLYWKSATADSHRRIVFNGFSI